MKIRIRNIVLAVMLCLLIAVPVSADVQGSLLLVDVEQPTLLFPVADKDGVPVAQLADAVELLSAEDLTPQVAKTVYEAVQTKQLSGTLGTANSQKEIAYKDLEMGWYLVCSASEQAEFTPFLICVPMSVDGEEQYDIVAEPKVDSPAEPSDPELPQPNIPQTGAIQWPKYVLLIVGMVTIGVGVFEVVRGREKHHE